MLVGNPKLRASGYTMDSFSTIFYCFQKNWSSSNTSRTFPSVPCPSGIRVNTVFPTCWDEVNLDSSNHKSHVAYSSTFESGGSCPSTHPVKIPEIMYETVWNTTEFNDPSLWPTDESQPFVWSQGDP